MKPKQPRTDQPRRGSLVAHPAFPAIVALWTATALVIAAMAIPASLLERAVAAARLDEVVPAARPPLGFTARMLLGFALALGGGLAGYVGGVALRRGREAPGAKAAPAPAPAPRPAPVAAEPVDDEEDLARLEAARPGGRRRALTSETAEAPSILEISAIPALESLVPGPLAEPAPSPAAQPPLSDAETTPTVAPPSVPFRSAAQIGPAAAERLRQAPLESLGVIQLVERFALALQAHRGLAGPAATPGLDQGALEPLAVPSPPFAEPRPAEAPPAPPTTGRPFDGPADPAPEIAPPPRARSLDPAAQVARWALPEPTGEDLDEDPSADPGYGSLTDLRPAPRAADPLASFVRVEDGAHEPAVAGPQPVVVFPGQAVAAPPLPTLLPGSESPASAEETEQALRDALAALQRLSGAA